jgi:hypothetical protein
MNACVGWFGPCLVHGDMHGCRHPDGHPTRWHECECGERRRAAQRGNWATWCGRSRLRAVS